jgi:hypothetical protein
MSRLQLVHMSKLEIDFFMDEDVMSRLALGSPEIKSTSMEPSLVVSVRKIETDGFARMSNFVLYTFAKL